MEEKKTTSADLERIRGWAFLIGIIVASALFVVAMEFSFSDRSSDLDSDFLDEIAEDMQMMPPMEENLPEPEKEAPVQSDQVVVVPEVSNVMDENDREVEKPEVILETEAPEVLDEKLEEVVPEEEEKNNDVRLMSEVDQLPQFPGGMSQLLKWLTQNLKYPERAKVAKVSGKVIVAFIVNTDGKVDDVRLIQRANIDLDNEALRVVKMMPKWESGKSQGKPCRTLVHLPIVFKL